MAEAPPSASSQGGLRTWPVIQSGSHCLPQGKGLRGPWSWLGWQRSLAAPPLTSEKAWEGGGCSGDI